MIYKFVMMVAWRRDSSSSDRNYGDERMSSATLLGIFVRDGTLYFFLWVMVNDALPHAYLLTYG